MSIAAVPSYLGQDFKGASPGMRFGLLLPIWTNRQDQEAEIKKRASAKSKQGQCGLARPRVLAGENPAWVIVSREPSIEPCGACGNSRVDV